MKFKLTYHLYTIKVVRILPKTYSLVVPSSVVLQLRSLQSVAYNIGSAAMEIELSGLHKFYPIFERISAANSRRQIRTTNSNNKFEAL